MPAKILVIDDDPEILNIIQLVLTQDGHQIVTSTNGKILNELPTMQPNLIMLDEVLCNEKGSDLCRQIKSNPETSGIPVIFLSALTGIANLADQAGAEAYLRKPFDIDDLNEVVTNSLNAQRDLPGSTY